MSNVKALFIADFQNWINLVKSVRQEKNVGVVRVKVDLQTKCTVRLLLLLVLLYSLSRLSRKKPYQIICM